MRCSIGSLLRKGNTNGTLPYSALPPEAITANSLGVVIVAFGLVVLKILSNQIWQRPDEAGYEVGIYQVKDKGICNVFVFFEFGVLKIVTEVMLIILS